ncbi:hypothetical protein UFOVP449_215 [uncultured Caudovirales phage]|uniref:VWFA domain containing protein n=1 Tax=uncultured Caudovirales phage TaxID=2100421 RepID=A0A6J5M9Z6_9CAUD|nr:hypothetical protein UFOVP449_215 [uncultured Caudovirales phage]
MSKKTKESRYSYGSSYSRSQHKRGASFWYDEYNYDYEYIDTYGSTYTPNQLESYKKTNNLYKLSSVRRAIANFVQIVTNKPVPVTFATKSDSKTDGQRVIISADVDDNFDVSVGLALHEGSHIVLSDFTLLNEYHSFKSAIDYSKSVIKQYVFDCKNNGITSTQDELDKMLLDTLSRNSSVVRSKFRVEFSEIALPTGRIGRFGIPTDEVLDTIGMMTNWLEDRRIDHYIYKSAPGYRDYYQSMYEYYFNDKMVTKGIASNEFTDETIQSYMFRIINFLNEETDLSKLKGLRSIYRKIDLKNISRLNSSRDAFNLAIDVVEIMLENIAQQNGGHLPQSGNGKADGQGGSMELTDSETDQQIQNDGDDQTMGGGNTAMDISGGTDSSEDTKGDASTGNTNGDGKLSKTALEQLIRKIQKQKDFLNGKIKKKSVSKEEIGKLNDIQESESELVRVGGDFNNYRGGHSGVDCIVVKRLTNNIIKSDDFPFSRMDGSTKELMVLFEEEVKRGITLGTLLGKKLQIRGESRETIFSRLKKGRIDKRMIASIGYDNDSVFYTNEIEQFKKANLHISLDYSGSMSGSKLRKTITSVVAIVKACEMARNVNVQVSIRSTDSGSHGKSLPYICMVHDSRRDSFKQFCKYMSILTCNNTTPEGLCFEAIQKYLIPTDTSVDSYFLNFSDGQPSYNIHTKSDNIYYNGESAAEHTYKQVKKMCGNGINVLSYFISERAESNLDYSSDWFIFKKSYGAHAKHINVENIMQVAKTINELFLTRPSKQ